MSTVKSDARLNFRLPAEIKTTIEEAAALTGQTVSDFAISTLAQTARQILRNEQVTRLSRRDQEAFLKMLDDETTQPNTALVEAAKRHKEQVI